MAKFHVGCSGFHYKHWKGSFYPEKLAQKNWFEYYCQHFDTLELNVTFYRFPELAMLRKWYNSSPDHFRFAVKAPRVITHFKKFHDTERLLDDFYHTVKEALGEKCGCCLFQLPPSYIYAPDKLERIVNSLHPSLPNVLEFRHSSWWQEDVFHILSKHHISFCGMSHPALPKDIICNTDLLYYRFHGDEQLYASKYNTDQLMDFSKAVSVQPGLKNAYVFFNNDIHTNAVYNAKELQGLLKRL